MCQSPIVLHGIDTVKVNVKLLDELGKPLPRQEVRPELVTMFECWQEQAKIINKPIPTSMTFHDTRMMMYPNGAPSWKFILRNDCLEVKACPRLKMQMIAKVTFQSAYLWKVGNTKDAIEEAHSFLEEVFNASVMLQAAQLDMCVDMVGLELPTEWEEVFISHALTKKPIGESSKDQVYYRGRNIETIIFSGHGNPINGKLYNKTREIQQSNKTWFRDYWLVNAWDGQAKVWRMEYSIEREGFNEMDLDDIYDALRNVKRLWAYCSHEWLRMAIPDASDKTRTRWATHALWRELQHAFDNEGDRSLDNLGPLVRKRKREKNIEQGIAAIAGYATTLAAWHEQDELSENADADTMFALILDKVKERWDKLDVVPQEVVRAKKFIYNQKG